LTFRNWHVTFRPQFGVLRPGGDAPLAPLVTPLDWCSRIRLNVCISLLEKESTTGSTLRSHHQSMEH